MNTTRTSKCVECGQDDARRIAIRYNADDVTYAYIHPACRDAVKARHAEWLASVEGRIALAIDAGLTPCNHCATTEDVHNWQTPDGNTGHLCLSCAVKIEKAGHPIEMVPTAEQVAELARWDAAGIGAN